MSVTVRAPVEVEGEGKERFHLYSRLCWRQDESPPPPFSPHIRNIFVLHVGGGGGVVAPTPDPVARDW